MASDYWWAHATVPRGWWSVGDLAVILGVSCRTARRALKRSGLPCKLYTRFWRHDGRVYRRQAWGFPEVTATVLQLERHRKTFRRLGRYGKRYALEIDREIARLRENLSQQPEVKRVSTAILRV